MSRGETQSLFLQEANEQHSTCKINFTCMKKALVKGSDCHGEGEGACGLESGLIPQAGMGRAL